MAEIILATFSWAFSRKTYHFHKVCQELIANIEPMFWRPKESKESLFGIQLVAHYHSSNNRHNDDDHHDNAPPKREKSKNHF